MTRYIAWLPLFRSLVEWKWYEREQRRKCLWWVSDSGKGTLETALEVPLVTSLPIAGDPLQIRNQVHGQSSSRSQARRESAHSFFASRHIGSRRANASLLYTWRRHSVEKIQDRGLTTHIILGTLIVRVSNSRRRKNSEIGRDSTGLTDQPHRYSLHLTRNHYWQSRMGCQCFHQFRSSLLSERNFARSPDRLQQSLAPGL